MNESKIICGYKCFKAEYIVNGFEGDIYYMYVYYTKDIFDSIPFYGQIFFAGLDGFPMEYNDKISSGYVIYSAIEISKGKIDEGIFLIPKDYRIINRD